MSKHVKVGDLPPADSQDPCGALRAIAAVVAFTVPTLACAAAPSGIAGPESLATLAEAPALELPRVDGRRVALSDYRGKAVLVVFFRPSRPTLQRDLASLEHLAIAVAPGLEVLPVAVIDPEEGAEREATQALEGKRFLGSALVLRHAYEAPAWAEAASSSTLFVLVAPDGSVRATGGDGDDLRSPRVISAVRGLVGQTRAVATAP